MPKLDVQEQVQGHDVEGEDHDQKLLAEDGQLAMSCGALRIIIGKRREEGEIDYDDGISEGLDREDTHFY